jgi:hypothetical protein
MATVRVGIAIGERELVASWRGRGAGRIGDRAWNIALADGPSRDALACGVSQLRQELGNPGRVVASLAILPPLARIRRIELPRMSDEDRRLAVSRSAERYFLGLGDCVLCAIEPLGRGTRSAAPFLAAGVSVGLIANVSAVMMEIGWTIDRIVPAHSAWLSLALARWPSLRRGDASVVVKGSAETTVLQLKGGSLAMARRVRPCDPISTSASGDEPPIRCQVISQDADEPAAAVAAHYVGRTRRLELVPEAERQVRTLRERRVVRHLVAAAAACMVFAAGAYRWSLARQLESVSAERAVLRVRVARAMAARDSLAELVRTASAIANLDASAPRWSAVLSRIAITLPTDALIDVFRGDADSVSMQGQATNAAAVFGALRGAAGVTSVRSNAPIRQELVAGHEASERWMLTLRVAHGDAARDHE